MRRFQWLLHLLLLAILVACGSIAPFLAPDTTLEAGATGTIYFETRQRTPPSEVAASLTPTTPVPEITNNQLSTPTTSATPTAFIAPDHNAFSVRTHPDGPLYVGDLVSMEVIAENSLDLSERQLQVELPDGTIIGPVDFGSFGIGQRRQATLTWAWDTSALEQGDYSLNFALLPDGERWTETFSLLPAADLPPSQTEAEWGRTQTDCCVIHYISGTAAERDLSQIVAAVDDQYERIAKLMEVELDESLTLSLLPRVLGHGGFASSEVSVSYLDRNYAGSTLDFVLGHEIIHKMDESLGGDPRPTILVEGLAVYLNGGHFKPEPLMARAAALLPPEEKCKPVVSVQDWDNATQTAKPCTLGWYIPLGVLSDNFYLSQHEIGYLQAGALVEYMIETWGTSAYSEFYRSIQPMDPEDTNAVHDYGPQGSAVDRALGTHFGITLAELENQFLTALQQHDLTAALVNDVRLTVEYYDAVRQYQQILDPSAYFLTAWLVDGDQMRERGIVGDYLRRPIAPENLALESMLVQADSALRAGEYAQVTRNLQAINAVLKAYEERVSDPFGCHPLAADYLAIVQIVDTAGYQIQKLEVEGSLARVWVTVNSANLVQLNLVRGGHGWEFTQGAQ